MRTDRGLVGNFVDLCDDHWLEPKDNLSAVVRFMDFCKTNKLNPARTGSLIADFMDLCESSELDPADGLAELEAQDWQPEEPVYTMQSVTIHEDFA
jgi:hypothetical protein